MPMGSWKAFKIRKTWPTNWFSYLHTTRFPNEVSTSSKTKFGSLPHWSKSCSLPGESYDISRNVICQLPPEAGYPAHIGARLKIPANGLNDAPRRWWNRLDTSLRSYGLIPTRADRCCYVLPCENNTQNWESSSISGLRHAGSWKAFRISTHLSSKLIIPRPHDPVSEWRVN